MPRRFDDVLNYLNKFIMKTNSIFLRLLGVFALALFLNSCTASEIDQKNGKADVSASVNFEPIVPRPAR